MGVLCYTRLMKLNRPPGVPTGDDASAPQAVAVAGGGIIDLEKAGAELRNVAQILYLHIAAELSKSPEAFPFPGMDPDAYAVRKAEEKEEADLGIELPVEITPIDTLLDRMRSEGIKVMMGSAGSLDAFILPRGSNDIVADGLLPRHLQTASGMDNTLEFLILSSRQYKSGNYLTALPSGSLEN